MSSPIFYTASRYDNYPNLELLQSNNVKPYIVKCQTEFNVQSSEIYLNPLAKNFFVTLVQSLKKNFSPYLIENSTVSIRDNRISVTPKDSLLGGITVQTICKVEQTISWKDGDNEFFLKQEGSWFELSCSLVDQIPELRNQLLNSIMIDFPIDSTLSFTPSDTKVIMLFCIPNSALDLNVISHVQSFLQGKSTTSSNDHQSMLIDKLISPEPISIDIISEKNLIKLYQPDDELFHLIKIALKVNEICLFHFISKKIDKENYAVIKRQINRHGIVSKIRQMESPLLSSVKLGITNDRDIQHNDHFYVHCFLGYPSTNNQRRISDRVVSDFSMNDPLNIAYTFKEGTTFLPLDQGNLNLNLKDFCFKFQGKKYTIKIDQKSAIITYLREKDILLSHHFTDEIFSKVDGLFLLLSKFIRQLSDDDKGVLFSDNGTLLKELFNDLFAFRTQVSFPGQLPYEEYSHPTSPKEKIHKLVNQEEHYVPDLKDCKLQFRTLFESMKPEKLELSKQELASLDAITGFFKKKYVHNMLDMFAYLGGTSAQLAIHFAPEICNEFTPNVLRAIFQIHFNCLTNSEGYEELDKLQLIKQFNTHRVTIFSLIEHSLHDLDAIQMRMPLNSLFDTPQFNVESAYLNQLTTLYQSGSVLLRSLYTLVTGDTAANPPMVPFFQKDHLKQTVEKGIQMLSTALELKANKFSNIHNFNVNEFFVEFTRGFEGYITETESRYGDVIQTTIADFEQSLLNGCTLLMPRFKHDLLDSKHFKAGIFQDKKYLFLDGALTFKELIKNALKRIQN